MGNRAEGTQLQRIALRLLRRNMVRNLTRHVLARVADICALVRTIPGTGQKRKYRAAMILAHWLAKRGDRNAAFATLERAQRAAPEDPRALIELGHAYDVENFQLALEFLEQAYALAPQSFEVNCAYGRLLSRLARHEDALTILEDTHLMNPDAIRPLPASGAR